MAVFWRTEHPDISDLAMFTGCVIRWAPLVRADALNIALRVA